MTVFFYYQNKNFVNQINYDPQKYRYYNHKYNIDIFFECELVYVNEKLTQYVYHIPTQN